MHVAAKLRRIWHEAVEQVQGRPAGSDWISLSLSLILFISGSLDSERMRPLHCLTVLVPGIAPGCDLRSETVLRNVVRAADGVQLSVGLGERVL